MVFNRLFKDDRGSSAIQFGFVAPMLIVLTLGIIDIGRMGFAASSVKYAASEAARYASVRGASAASPATETEIKDYAKDRAVGVPGVIASVTWTPDNSSGSQVTVQATYSMSFFLQSFTSIAPVQITRTSTMVIF